MAKITIQVSGDKELAAQLKALPPAVARDNLLDAVDGGAEIIQEATRENIRSRSGSLAGSIFREPTLKTKTRVAYSVGAGEKYGFYARFVELGHGGPHPAPPHPFMRPAFDENIDRAVDEIMARLRRRINAVVGR